MPTHITQIDDDEAGRIILRVDGDMYGPDAQLLEKIVGQIGANSSVVIDLADLDFLDSDAAAVLRRISDEGRVEIAGIEIFLQTSVNVAERNDT